MAHNVFRVDGNGFQECTAPAETEAPVTENDVVTLTTPGRKWYICGVGQHCEAGKQRLAITVLAQSDTPAASPLSSNGGGGGSSVAFPPSRTTRTIGCKPYAWMTAALCLLMIAMVYKTF